jgi:hypothetical protein
LLCLGRQAYSGGVSFVKVTQQVEVDSGNAAPRSYRQGEVKVKVQGKYSDVGEPTSEKIVVVLVKKE